MATHSRILAWRISWAWRATVCGVARVGTTERLSTAQNKMSRKDKSMGPGQVPGFFGGEVKMF